MINNLGITFTPPCSRTRCAKQKCRRCSSQSASCSAFTLGTVPQYLIHAIERITTLRFAQQRKITLNIFLEGVDHLDSFYPLTTTQVIFIQSFILTRLPSSAKLELSLSSFCLLFFLEGLHLLLSPSRTQFSL
jgi:hypothetical protein